MDLLTLTLLIILCYGLYYYFKKTLNYFEERGVPYIPGWPVIGNFATIIFRRQHFSELIKDIYYAYPDAKYVGVFDFTSPAVLVRDPELIKSITIKNFENFHDHASFIDHSIDPLMGGALFNLAGDRWKEARNLLSPAFTSSKMKCMYELMVNCVRNYVDYLSKKSVEENRMIGTKNFFARFTNDVIATCAFGIEVDSLNDPDNDFYVLGKKATNLEGILAVKFFLSRAMPYLLKFFKVKFVNEKIAKFFMNIVGTTVKTRDEKGISRPDMLQLMMDARKKGNQHIQLDIIEMTAQAFSFFFGGFDTTSTQMCIMAHELAINPEVQEKLQEEIDEVLRNGEPSYETINEMPYLDAVFNESMRMHTQASILDRLCTKEFELPPALPGLDPYVIKPGTYIWFSPYAMHNDPQFYENPGAFDPDRYYNKKMTLNDVTFLGFGIGPRACIGNRFAILETKILFFFLLSKFNLRPNEKTTNPLKYSKKTFTVSAEGGFWLSIVPRKIKS